MAGALLCPRCSAVGEDITRADGASVRYCGRCNLVWRDDQEHTDPAAEYPRSSADRAERAAPDDEVLR